MNNLEYLGDLQEFVAEVRHRLKLFNPYYFASFDIKIPVAQTQGTEVIVHFSNRQGSPQGKFSHWNVGFGFKERFTDKLEDVFLECGLRKK
ncbi:MAG: hypothetical protein ACRC4X_05415 [Cetobacterium sp.]